MLKSLDFAVDRPVSNVWQGYDIPDLGRDRGSFFTAFFTGFCVDFFVDFCRDLFATCSAGLRVGCCLPACGCFDRGGALGDFVTVAPFGCRGGAAPFDCRRAGFFFAPRGCAAGGRLRLGAARPAAPVSPAAPDCGLAPPALSCFACSTSAPRFPGAAPPPA